jgi:serine/threonine protein kinase
MAGVTKAGDRAIWESRTNMIGRTIGHYRITARLGAGGMAEVFLAEDTRLDRKAAIKFLPAEMAAKAVWRTYPSDGRNWALPQLGAKPPHSACGAPRRSERG